MDPDAEVALAVATLMGSSSDKAALLRSGGYSTLENGPHPALNDRTVPVLDAFAEICVKASGSDVAAIALKMRSATTESTIATNDETPKMRSLTIQLVIATNDKNPSPETIDHLVTVWGLLKKISDQKFSSSGTNVNLRDRSPPVDIQNEKEQALYDELFLHIYRYSYLKVQQRHKKYWSILERFTDLHQEWMKREQDSKDRGKSAQDDEDQKINYKSDLFTHLGDMVVLVQAVNDRLIHFHENRWEVDANEMTDLKSEWQMLQTCAKAVLDDETACEIWAERVTSGTPCRLRRAIEKIISFHRQVATVIRFAFSPRMRMMFHETELSIVPVVHEAPTTVGKWPSDETAWHELLGEIYARHALIPATSSRALKAQARVMERLACTGKKTIHCECALISHLHRYCDSFPAFSYIGISKLSCKPCHFWISAYNKHAGAGKYRTKGSHDKWYPGWIRPSLGDAATQAKVDDAFVKLVEEELCTKQEAADHARSRSASDSSNSSEQEVPRFPPGNRCLERARAKYRRL